MLRLVAVCLIVVGFLLFLGNLTRMWPTVPGMGVGVCVVGILLLRYDQTVGVHSIGVEEWR
jgi:hypothetical protein